MGLLLCLFIVFALSSADNLLELNRLENTETYGTDQQHNVDVLFHKASEMMPLLETLRNSLRDSNGGENKPCAVTVESSGNVKLNCQGFHEDRKITNLRNDLSKMKNGSNFNQPSPQIQNKKHIISARTLNTNTRFPEFCLSIGEQLQYFPMSSKLHIMYSLLREMKNEWYKIINRPKCNPYQQPRNSTDNGSIEFPKDKVNENISRPSGGINQSPWVEYPRQNNNWNNTIPSTSIPGENIAPPSGDINQSPWADYPRQNNNWNNTIHSPFSPDKNIVPPSGDINQSPWADYPEPSNNWNNTIPSPSIPGKNIVLSSGGINQSPWAKYLGQNNNWNNTIHSSFIPSGISHLLTSSNPGLALPHININVPEINMQNLPNVTNSLYTFGQVVTPNIGLKDSVFQIKDKILNDSVNGVNEITINDVKNPHYNVSVPGVTVSDVHPPLLHSVMHDSPDPRVDKIEEQNFEVSVPEVAVSDVHPPLLHSVIHDSPDLRVDQIEDQNFDLSVPEVSVSRGIVPDYNRDKPTSDYKHERRSYLLKWTSNLLK